MVVPKLNFSLKGLLYLGSMTGGYFVTTVINQSLPFLIVPILVRYMNPAEYSNIALFTLYLSFANSLSGVSIATVISKFFFITDRTYLAKIIGNALYIVAGLSLLFLALIAVMHPWIKDMLGLPLKLMLLIPPTSFAFIVFSMGLNVMRNSRQVLEFSKHKIANTVINLVASLIFVVLLLWGWRGRIAGIMVANLFSAVAALYYLIHKGYISFHPSKELLKKIIAVLTPMIPNSLQSVIISQVGIVFVQYYFSKNTLGLYSMGFQLAFIVGILVETLVLSWSPFMFEQLAGRYQDNKMYITRMYYAFSGIVVLGAISVSFLAGIILKIMTNPSYYGAKEFVPWFCLGFMFKGLYSFLLPVLVTFNKEKRISTITLINMVVMIAANIVLIRVFGYIGAAYAFCLTYFIMYLCFIWEVRKVLPLPWFKALELWKST